jgi:NADPH-dependent glutamate synthase beta subunit-like oxidoreductase
MGKLALIGRQVSAVEVARPAKRQGANAGTAVQRAQRTNHVSMAARETVEAHAAIEAFEARLHALRMAEHDLASEMIARRNALRQSALDDIAELGQ